MITNWILGAIFFLIILAFIKTPLVWPLLILWGAFLGIFSGVDLDEFWSEIWKSDEKEAKSL